MCTNSFAGIAIAIVVGLVASAAGAPPLHTVSQRWVSDGVDFAEADSIAACILPDGRVRVFVTCKSGNRVQVLDGESGRHVATYGAPGDGHELLRYPNGMVCASLRDGEEDVVARTAVLVVERDNKRVHAFWADDLSFAGSFGESVLIRPYGAAVTRRDDFARRAAAGKRDVATLPADNAAAEVYCYVTEDAGRPTESVRVFRVWREGNRVRGEHLGNFGDADGPGTVREPESIAIDDRTGRVFLCDEHKSQRNVKVYTLEGKFSGTTFADGLLRADPEGIAVFSGSAGELVLLTEQRKQRTIWHVFDADRLEWIASFTGAPTIANTDGICVVPESFGSFERGVLLAVHDDRDVRAYSLGDVLELLAGRAAQP